MPPFVCARLQQRSVDNELIRREGQRLVDSQRACSRLAQVMAAEVSGNFAAVKTAVDDNAATLADFGTSTGGAAAGNGAECTLGEVKLSAGTVVAGAPAQGQLMPIAQNQALFAPLGTTIPALPFMR